MQINKIIKNINGIGNSAYNKLRETKKQETLSIIFTKGKLEILTEDVERINVYDESMNIIKKDNTALFVNLYQITYME